jgi:hypothetical protein
MPAEPSVREFKFDEREFKLLPEVEPELSKPRLPPAQRPKTKTSISRLWMGIGSVVAASLVYLVWQGTDIARALPLARSNQLDVTASREGPGLRVNWNNASRAFDNASRARLVISRDGSGEQSVQLGLDDLRLGAVQIENSAPRVDVTLVVDVPGSSSVTQSVRWERP